MKIIKFLTVAIILSFVYGCGFDNKTYDDYKHYEFEDVELNYYVYNKNQDSYVYAVGDVSNLEEDENQYSGVLYKVGDKDYILLDKISFCGNNGDLHLDKSRTYFYEDKENDKMKLYTFRCFGMSIFEYIFDEADFQKKELKFDTTKVSDKDSEETMFNYIEKVDSKYIYFNGQINNTEKQDLSIRCSLDDYVCDRA